MVTDERLEHYLAQQGVVWEVIPPFRQSALEGEWNSVYGDVWKLGLRRTHGVRAENEYSQRSATLFLIVPFLGKQAGPHGLGKRGPRTAAYECRGTGELPNLSEFSHLDFFVASPDLSWTMLHTHEDYSLGGPYFMERSWLARPTRRPFAR
jgi:hypothetical protein